VRFPAVLSAIIPFIESDKGAPKWTDTALAILDSAPDRATVLAGLVDHFRPRGWSGSLADKLERRRALPQAFFLTLTRELLLGRENRMPPLAGQAEDEVGGNEEGRQV